MIFDQNNKNFQPDTLPEQSLEKAKPIEMSKTQLDSSPVKPLGSEKPQLDLASTRPAEQAKPQPDPHFIRIAEQTQKLPDVSPLKVFEQAEPLSAEISSTDSLMEVILPAEKLKTIPAASAVNKTNKKIIAVGRR